MCGWVLGRVGAKGRLGGGSDVALGQLGSRVRVAAS